MSSVNHTPGPWSVGIADWTDAGNARYELRGIKTVSAPDARLIESAPELLAERERLKAANAEVVEALDVLVDVLDDEENNAPEHRRYVEGAWKVALNEARTALGKHQGEAK